MPPSSSPFSDWNAEQYAQHARFVTDYGEPLLDLLRLRSGQRVLDLGCGDGVTAQRLSAEGFEVVGIDASPDMIAAAQARGVDARWIDARQLPFHEEFDAVLSNAVLHWIKPPEDVAAGVARALKAGGRFVGEFGGAGNVAAVYAALKRQLAMAGHEADRISPWYFPTPQAYRTILESHGFAVETLEHFPRPTPLPGDILDWLRTFAGRFLDCVPAEDHDTFLAAVRETLRPELYGADGRWSVDYVRLRFAAVRK